MADLIVPGVAADFLLAESRERGDVLTNLKLQKFLYYSQAWFLALAGCALFDEDFQAWVHGPVLPSQYRRFKTYEWRPIVADVVRPRLERGRVQNHLVEIVNVFGNETAISLEQMTHRELPWIEARGKLPMTTPSTAVISKKTMAKYYKALSK